MIINPKNSPIAIGVDSWATVQDVVRRGFAPTLFPVGMQFVCNWAGQEYPLDVVDNDYTVWTDEDGVATQHSALALMFHNQLYDNSVYYDAGESTFANWGKTGDGVKTFADLSAEIYAAYPHLDGEAFQWFNRSGRAKVADSDSTEVTVSGTDYIANTNTLGTGASNVVNYGNGAPYVCNVMQWLNSDKAGGTWFEPWHVGDEAPSYANTDGFLTKLEKGLADVLVPCALSEENLSLSHRITKVHLPVYQHVNGNATYAFAYYGESPLASDRIKKLRDGTDRSWLLNTNYQDPSYQCRAIQVDGTIDHARANSTSGKCPVFYIF
jgi:hypothetical protein